VDNQAFAVEVSVQAAVTILKPVGWLNADTRVLLEEKLRSEVGGGSRRMVVDLSSAHFPDNSGTVVFALWKGRLADLGGCLVLAAPSGSALRALLAGRLDKYIPVCDSVVEAVELAAR